MAGNRWTIWFGLLAFGSLGILMVAHGLGLTDAAWMNPNPHVPLSIFTLVGAMLIAAMPLLLAQLMPMHKSLLNLAGYGFIAGAMVVAHWMVFFAEGGSCSLDSLSFGLTLPLSLCTITFGAILLIIDLALIIFALRWLKVSSAARSKS